MGCGCGSKPAYVVNPRRGSVDSWSVIYPHGSVRPFASESAARLFIQNRANPTNYTLIDPSGTHVPM